METNIQVFELIKNKEFDNIIKLLQQDGIIDVNLRDNNNVYIIQYAIMYNSVELIKTLINKNCKIDFIDDEGHSILYIPIKFNYINILRLLLNNTNVIGIPLIDISDKTGNLPIHYSIYFGNKDAFDVLIENVSQYNKLNDDGYSALHLSVIKKNYYALEKLMEIDSVNINTQNMIGETALHLACNYEDEKAIEILINSNKPIDVDIIDSEDQITPLMYIVTLNNIKITKKILSKNPKINIQNANGNTALHIAIIENNYVIANILCTKNNNYNLTNINGMTALHLLLYETLNMSDELDVILSRLNKYNIDLLFNKTKLNMQDNDGNTVWHLLANNDLWLYYKNIFRTTKNNIFIKNSQNITPFDIIKKGKNFDTYLDIIIDSYYYTLINNKIEYISDWENKCSLKKQDMNKCKENIKKNILENSRSVPEKKTSYCMVEFDKDIDTLFTTFTGSSIDIICGLKMLHEKYKIVSSLNNKNLIDNEELNKYYLQMGIRKNTFDFLNFEIQWLYQNIFFPDNFETVINLFIKNKNIKYLVIPIGIELENGAHANILIYDKSSNVLERFEPNGSDEPPKFNYNGLLLDTLLKKYFLKYFKNMEYITPKMFLPKIGFQAFENIESIKNKKIGDPGGFCAAWCLWYAYYRLKYQNVEQSKLVSQLITHIKYNNYTFKTIIRNFSKNLNIYRDNILSQVNIDVNQWLNNQYDLNVLKSLQKIIINDLL